MNEITQRRSVLVDMAARHGMEPAAFEQTLRATVVPRETTREQFAAFLMVARDYNLNPITRQIFAFPTRAGGIQPIVSVDGWMQIYSHPQMDGLEFEDVFANGDLIGIKCRIFRKDRTRPTEVIEYMAECRRGTDTWKQYPIRMLRHKAAIQAARYAFGFSGIVEPDEFERMSDQGQVIRAPAKAPIYTLEDFAKAPEKPKRRTKKEMAEEYNKLQDAIEVADQEIWDEPEEVEQFEPEEDSANPKRTYSQTPHPPDVESAADAHQMGQEARRGHAKRTQWPAQWRDQTNIEAWLAGWDVANEELKAPDK